MPKLGAAIQQAQRPATDHMPNMPNALDMILLLMK